MRSLLLTGVLSALIVTRLVAQQTVVVTSAGGTGRFADGTAWPTTGDFNFEVGVFPAGFDPAAEARATWAAAWLPLRSTVAAGAVTGWFRDGSSTLFSISASGGTTGGGGQYYVWGSNARLPREGAEWILLTNPAWRVIPGDTARLPDNFDLADAGTVAVFGDLARGGRDLQSAPAFPGRLRLITPPSDVTVVAGEPATLSVNAGGSGFAYQWYEGRKGDTTRPLAGARQATYTLPAVPRTATFWVRLTDGVNHLDSETVTVTAADREPDVVATQTFVAGARLGESLEVRAEVSLGGAAGRVDFAALLPPGWQLAGSESPSAFRRPAAGATELLEWSWAEVPAGTLRFRYHVVPPAGLSAEAVISAIVTLERAGVTSRSLVQPEQLRLTIPVDARSIP